jgi:hypothetical protein
MEAMREAWTDERLDDLANRVDKGFEGVDARFERVEGDIRSLRSEMNNRFDSVQRSMMQAVVAISVGMLAGFGGLAGLIATQL